MPREGPFLGEPPFSSPVVSEHPYVKLDEWWLARVEGQERKIAVAGIFKGNQAALDFSAAPIAKCHKPDVLETENGIVLVISGILNIKRTLENGFTTEACEKFSCGFPDWWENWNVPYRKMLRSQTESQPRSLRTSNSREEITIFHLEMFQLGKLAKSLARDAFNNAEAFSGNCDAFPDSSRFPNGAPRFDEFNWDDDTPIKTSAASSNHDNNNIENIETDLIGARILKEIIHDGIDWNITSASAVKCTNDEGNTGMDNDEGNTGMDNDSHVNNGRQNTHVTLLKKRGCLKKPQHVALSESTPSKDTPTAMQSLEKGKKPVVPRKQRSASRKLQSASRSPDIINQIPYCSSPLARSWAKSFSVSTPESLKLQQTRSGRVVVPALDSGCQNIVYNADGSISAIIGLYPSPPLKGSTTNYATKKKRT